MTSRPTKPVGNPATSRPSTVRAPAPNRPEAQLSSLNAAEDGLDDAVPIEAAGDIEIDRQKTDKVQIDRDEPDPNLDASGLPSASSARTTHALPGGLTDPDVDDLDLDTYDTQGDDDTDPQIAAHQYVNVPALRAPLIGRNKMLERLKDVLLDTWHRRQPNFVTISGAPGTGKTRLAREFARSVSAAIPSARVLRGLATDASAPYEALARALAERFGAARAEAPDDIRAKITSAVEESLPGPLQEEVAHLLAHLMGIPFPESPVIDALARDMRDLDLRCHIAVRRFLEQQSEKGPLLLLLDRIEHAAPETVDLLHYLAENMRDHPVMILTVARPEIFARRPRWGQGHMEYHQIDLVPMPPDEALELLNALIGTDRTPDEIASVARNRLDGNPRALHDLARFLLESGIVDRRDGEVSISAEQLAAVPIPSTHEDLLRARLRTLSALERSLLEHASALGEVFWTDALVALARASALNATRPDGPPLDQILALVSHTNAQIDNGLGALVRRGLIDEVPSSSIAGEREYRFAYKPVCKLVLESLQNDSDAKANRRKQHRLIAQWLELRPEGRREQLQEQIGKQLEWACDLPAATIRYRRAAVAAAQRYDHDKAAQLYEQAIRCIGDTDPGGRLQLWHDVSQIYGLQGRLTAARDAAEKMLRLSWVIASRPKTAVALATLGNVYRATGKIDIAMQQLRQALEMYREAGDDRGVASTFDNMGQVDRLAGRYDSALDHCANALEVHRRLGSKRAIAASLSSIGDIEKERGLFEEAESCYLEAQALRRESADRLGGIASLKALGELEYERGKLDVARTSWERALAEAKRAGATLLQTELLIDLGELSARQNRIQQARSHLDEASALSDLSGAAPYRVDTLRNLGLVALLEGNTEKARHHATECLNMANELALWPLVGKAEMAIGEVHAATLFDASAPADPSDSAERHFRKAIEIFSGTGNDPDLARSLRRLGQYKVERSEWDEGRRALRDAIDLFTRMRLESEVREVEQMIAELP